MIDKLLTISYTLYEHVHKGEMPMPKLIPKAKEHILAAARKLLLEKGYSGLALRQLAAQCDVAVGTIYNYFANKEMLVASVMAEDWTAALKGMQKDCENAATVKQGVRAIHDGICAFAREYEPVWRGYAGIPSGFGQRHIMLRNQLAGLLKAMIDRLGHKEPGICPLLAEAVLACAMQKDIEYTALREMVDLMFPRENNAPKE
jgi:AcrR family transcriptional regulator